MSNRGSSNKGFIRTGQNSAVVEIKLCNQGETKYKPDLYGESITVMRTVTNSSSSYKLKDQHGRVVVEKKVKEELDNILTHFNIQVRSLSLFFRGVDGNLFSFPLFFLFFSDLLRIVKNLEIIYF